MVTDSQKKTKAVAKPSPHPKYSEMISAAILNLKERNGSSRQAIIKYIRANYTVGDNVESCVRQALRKKPEFLVQVKGTGASGSFKLAKAAAKAPKPKKPAAKPAKKSEPKTKTPKKPSKSKKATTKTAKASSKTKSKKKTTPAKAKAGKVKSTPAKKSAKKPAAKKTKKTTPKKKPAAKKSTPKKGN